MLSVNTGRHEITGRCHAGKFPVSFKQSAASAAAVEALCDGGGPGFS
ncbi:MAG: hypothetical protein ABIP13_01420 [Tepidiformaceae bacterium]